MAAYKFTTIITILFLMETCIANLETIEFKLGDRKIRIPVTQLAQGKNSADTKVLVPDSEANSNAYVPLQSAQSLPTLPRYSLPSHNHYPIDQHSPLSNINYPPPPSTAYARYQPNPHPEDQFSSYYEDQQSPNQYYPPHHHESAHYSHQEEQPQYPTGYNHPYHPHTHNHQGQPYVSPYLPNYGYPKVNYLNNRFPEWQQQYQARPYLRHNNNYGNISPNIYKPQIADLQNTGELSRKLDSTKSRRIAPILSPNSPQKLPIIPMKNNTQQKPTGFQMKNPKFSAIKTQPLSRSKQFLANASKDVSRRNKPILSEKLMSSDPPPLVPRRHHNLRPNNKLKNKAMNVRPIPATHDKLKMHQMPKQHNKPFLSAILNPRRNEPPKSSKNAPAVKIISDTLDQGSAIDISKDNPVPNIINNPLIEVLPTNTDYIATAPSGFDSAILSALEALSLNEDSKTNSPETLPLNVEPVVIESSGSPQENKVMDTPLALLPLQEAQTNAPEISITMPDLTAEAFEQYLPSEPLVQDTTEINVPEILPVQFLNADDFANNPVSDMITKEQNMETDSPLFNINTDTFTLNEPNTDSVLEEITTDIPSQSEMVITPSQTLATTENVIITEEPTVDETPSFLVQDTLVYLPIVSSSTENIITTPPETTPNVDRHHAKTSLTSLNMGARTDQYITTTEPVSNSDTNVTTKIVEIKDTELASPEENTTSIMTARSIEYSTEASQLVMQNTTVVDTKGIVATTHKPHRHRPCKKRKRRRGDGHKGKSGKSGRRRRRRRSTTVRPPSTILSAPTSANLNSTVPETNT